MNTNDQCLHLLQLYLLCALLCMLLYLSLEGIDFCKCLHYVLVQNLAEKNCLAWPSGPTFLASRPCNRLDIIVQFPVSGINPNFSAFHWLDKSPPPPCCVWIHFHDGVHKNLGICVHKETKDGNLMHEKRRRESCFKNIWFQVQGFTCAVSGVSR